MAVIRLKWKDWSLSEQGQRIYRSLDPIDTNNLPPVYAHLDPDLEYFEDTNVVVGTKYHYIVSAFKNNIEKFSDPIIIDTSLSPLGPGPEDLMGHNESAGFFGLISYNEVINGGDLAELVGLYEGDVNNNVNWLKFLVDGKILFTPINYIRSNMTWNALNDRDLVFGNRIVYIKDYAFKIRLIKGGSPDTAIPYQGGYDTEYSWGSEWNRLIYNIVNIHPTDPYQKNSQVGENWANYSLSSVTGNSSSSRYVLCQESAADDNQCVVRSNRGSITYVGSHAKSSGSVSYVWKPVLELVTT